MIKAIVVDDHELFRAGVIGTIQSRHPDISVVGEAGSGEEFFRLLKTTSADIVLLDMVLPDMTGVEIARRLRKEYPAMRILAISSANTAEVIKALLDVGIDGFISKQKGGANELAVAVRNIMDGSEYFGTDISAIIYKIYVEQKKTTEITSEFTERERDILLLCRDGLIGKEIADRLGITLRTVTNHKYNIFKKLGINNTVEMVQYALKRGIIRMDS